MNPIAASKNPLNDGNYWTHFVHIRSVVIGRWKLEFDGSKYIHVKLHRIALPSSKVRLQNETYSRVPVQLLSRVVRSEFPCDLTPIKPFLDSRSKTKRKKNFGMGKYWQRLKPDIWWNTSENVWTEDSINIHACKKVSALKRIRSIDETQF